MSENGFCKLSITLQFYYYIIIHDNKWKQVLKNSSNKRTPDSVEEKEWGVVWEGANRNESRTSFFFNDTATTEIYTVRLVGSVRCV